MAFDALLDHCNRTALLPWLEGEIAERRDQHPSDYFLQNCVANILQKEGRSAEAFDLLQKADFCAPDPATSLRTLVAEAERIGKLASACEYPKKLVYFVPPDDPQPLLKLVAQEFKNSRIQEFKNSRIQEPRGSRRGTHRSILEYLST